MADNSKIEWTDSTFNPWIGCEKISPGCDNCYAAAQDKFRSWTPEGWGGPRKRTSPGAWHAPVAWNKKAFYQCLDCGQRFAPPSGEGFVTCPGCGKYGGKFASDEEDGARVKQVRRRVFCASLADVFDNQVPVEWRADLLMLIRATPKLDWLLLTKRVGNVLPLLREAEECLRAQNRLDGWDWLHEWTCGSAPHNVWLGATVVNQEEADRDIPKLLATPARVRFLSMEPLLGPVEFSNVSRRTDAVKQLGKVALAGIHWVIVGGESGPGARSAQLQWVRDSVRQCRAAGVPVLVKQLGREVLDDGMSSPGEHWPLNRVRQPIPRRTEDDPGFLVRLQDRKGGDWHEWPEDLRVRQFPEVR